MKLSSSFKSDIWKTFPLVYRVTEDGSKVAVDYFCACVKCQKVYMYKDANGKHFGTKNQLEHVKRCTGNVPSMQRTLKQCMQTKTQLSATDRTTMKQRQMLYCINGHHSFKAVENDGLRNLMQTCIDLGAKYGKFDAADAAVSRKTISREVASAVDDVRRCLVQRLQDPVADGTLSLCIDMYTDDYRKRAYLDVHSSWVERDFTSHHTALAVRHFGSDAHTAENIHSAVAAILAEYSIGVDDTPITTDHGSNVVAALKNGICLDCMCHRLHTVLQSAWKDTREQVPEAAAYEVGISELCRFAKQSTGVQEQLPKSLKHGGDNRPWISMFRRADAVECSYDALVTVLTSKSRVELLAGVNRSFNREILELISGIKEVFESLEKVNAPTLNLVAPSYYLLMAKFAASGARESAAVQTFRRNLRKYMDDKFWPSIVALHWMATFLDPSFRNLQFIPQISSADINFKRNLNVDLDGWLMSELDTVTDRQLQRRTAAASSGSPIP